MGSGGWGGHNPDHLRAQVCCRSYKEQKRGREKRKRERRSGRTFSHMAASPFQFALSTKIYFSAPDPLVVRKMTLEKKRKISVGFIYVATTVHDPHSTRFRTAEVIIQSRQPTEAHPGGGRRAEGRRTATIVPSQIYGDLFSRSPLSLGRTSFSIFSLRPS